MKKILFFAAIAAAAFTSCSQEDELANGSASQDQAVGFSAYSGTTVTRGTTMSTEDFTAGNVGVFAFYQPATDGVAGPNFTTVKYSTANFMYNQELTYSTDKWSYSPVKYWPNNKGDKVTYFAYAPYNDATVWDDLNVSTNNSGTVVYRKFSVNSNVAEQTDYLFAAPNLNLTKPTDIEDHANPVAGTGSATVTAVKDASGSGSNVVNFNFKHVTSKINLYVGVQVNDEVNKTNGSYTAAADDAKAWTDPYTTIEIKSIQFKDLAKDFTVTATYADANTATCDQASITSVGSTKDSERNQTYVVKPGFTKTTTLPAIQCYTDEECKTMPTFRTDLYTKDDAGYAKATYYNYGQKYYTLTPAEFSESTWEDGTTYYTFANYVYSVVNTDVVKTPVTGVTYYTIEATEATIAGSDLMETTFYTLNGYIVNGWTEGWHRYLSSEENTIQNTVEANPTTINNDHEYMFIAPQEVGKDQQIVITYTVTTKVEAGKTNNNDSQVTNTIVKTWSDLGITKLEAGKQYQLYFLIGMQDVKVAATTCDWQKGSDNLVNVPKASETPVLP